MKHLLLGKHPSIEKIRELVAMVSDTAFNVLILGETGTGKEVVARLLHHSSTRRGKRFIKVNCAALPLTLLESELFGYEKGAFTGADRLKPGKFELASEGVSFLDEIGDMPLVLQAMMLHVLQSGEFSRLGGTRAIRVDAWVISSTNHDLEKDMKEGLFREDLFYRLNIIKVEMPPLRERKSDIPLLTDHFIREYRRGLGIGEDFELNGEMMGRFQEYHWPGNIRELSSTILRLMMGDDPAVITSELLCNMKSNGVPPGSGLFSFPVDGKQDVREEEVRSLKKVKSEAAEYIERKAILHALNVSGWNKRKTARMLDISYKTLFYKMEKLEIRHGRAS
jgi:two-component system response regulator AtoC